MKIFSSCSPSTHQVNTGQLAVSPDSIGSYRSVVRPLRVSQGYDSLLCVMKRETAVSREPLDSGSISGMSRHCAARGRHPRSYMPLKKNKKPATTF